MTTVYKYKTVPMAPVITATSKKKEGQQAASYLQSIINLEATNGWEFYRVDTFAVQQPSGCLGVGSTGDATTYYVATFRRPMPGDSASGSFPPPRPVIPR